MVASTWLRPIGPPAAQAPLVVVLPHAGGSASYYWPFGQLLADTSETWAVQYPGRQDRHREPQLGSVEELGAVVAAELATHAPSRRLVLFGHSMGAVVAFEAARAALGLGLDVVHLVVSGRGAPSRAPATLAIDRDDVLVAELARLSGTDPAALADPDLLAMVLTALRADYRIVQQYRCASSIVLDVPVTVLHGRDDAMVTAASLDGWRQHSSGQVRVVGFEGGHFYLVDRATEVADELRLAADR